MNEPISWDSSLVKKFSSSNHFKLLNQLRNEVKKYPLNNKKNLKSIQTKDTNKDSKNKSIIEHPQNESSSNNTNKSNDLNSNQSNVSFNNSKNFSIYNQTTNNKISRKKDNLITETSKSNNNSSSQSFIERLDQIDMK